MKHLFISQELALKLKEKKFNEPCLGYYGIWSTELQFPVYAGELENWNTIENLCSAPLYQQVIDWFREKHNISIELHWQQGSQGWSYCYGYNAGDWFFPKETYKYYEALTKAIEEAIKLI